MHNHSRNANGDNGHMHGRHSHAEAPPWLLKLGIALTFGTFALGMIFWHFSGSIAVLADSLHSIFHTSIYSVALWGNVHGNLRKQARASLIIGLIIITISLYIGTSGTISILFPTEVVSWHMIVIASVAIISETVQAKLMYTVKYRNTHVRKIYLVKFLLYDVLIDFLASLGVLLGGIVIMTTEFYRADGIAAIPISLAALGLGITVIVKSRKETKGNLRKRNNHND